MAFVICFSKRLCTWKNPCNLGTLTQGLPEPSPIIYQKTRAASIRSNTYFSVNIYSRE